MSFLWLNESMIIAAENGDMAIVKALMKGQMFMQEMKMIEQP